MKSKYKRLSHRRLEGKSRDKGEEEIIEDQKVKTEETQISRMVQIEKGNQETIEREVIGMMMIMKVKRGREEIIEEIEEKIVEEEMIEEVMIEEVMIGEEIGEVMIGEEMIEEEIEETIEEITEEMIEKENSVMILFMLEILVSKLNIRI